MKAHIVVLEGDGVGPEVTAEAVKVLQAIGKRFGHSLEFSKELIGGASIDRHGVPLTDKALAACKASDAVLLGAVGGPGWDNPAAEVRPEQGLLQLRKELGVYANLRPVKLHPSLSDVSPLKPGILGEVDLLFVRELTGGLYFGKPRGRQEIDGHVRAIDTLEYHDFEIQRVLRLAYGLAQGRRRKVTSVDKANVLESSRLWRQLAASLKSEFPGLVLENMLVDTASMRLMTNPSAFDVIVTENMFGDILTDEASVLAGSMGLLPSASLGNSGPGLFEPIHGSAPDIAGKGVANPVGAILSAAMLLRYSLHLENEAAAVESAVADAITDGHRTPDLGGTDSTSSITDAVFKRLFALTKVPP